jgi:hypothetical protein
LAVGDLRGTGRQDIVTVSYLRDPQTPFINRYWNNGDGTFERGPDLPVPAPYGYPEYDAIQIADINGDGRPDLVFLSRDYPTIGLWVFLGDGEGGFQTPLMTSIQGSWGTPEIANMAIADFNRDGKLDVSFVGYVDGSTLDVFTTPLAVLLGNGDGTFTPAAAIQLPSGYVSVQGPIVAADFNGDGVPDIAIGVCPLAQGCEEPPWWSLEVFLGKGDGSFQPPVQTALGFTVQENWFIAGDVNGDSIPDIIAYGYPGGLQVLYGQGNGGFQPPISLAVPYCGLSYTTTGTIADLNHDGHMDVVAVNQCENGSPVLLGKFVK